MIQVPEVTQSEARMAAVLRMTVPRARIQQINRPACPYRE